MAKAKLKNILLLLNQIFYIYYLVWFKKNKIKAPLVK